MSSALTEKANVKYVYEICRYNEYKGSGSSEYYKKNDKKLKS